MSFMNYKKSLRKKWSSMYLTLKIPRVFGELGTSAERKESKEPVNTFPTLSNRLTISPSYRTIEAIDKYRHLTVPGKVNISLGAATINVGDENIEVYVCSVTNHCFSMLGDLGAMYEGYNNDSSMIISMIAEYGNITQLTEVTTIRYRRMSDVVLHNDTKQTDSD